MWLLSLLFACGTADVPADTEVPAPAEEPKAEKPNVEKPGNKEGVGKATKKEMIDADCNATLQSLGGVEGDIWKIKCADGCVTGSVYGTDMYTADSKVCTAAVHAGAIPAGGGMFKAKIEGKSSDFKASKQNGIESKAWTSEWGPTFHVQAKK